MSYKIKKQRDFIDIFGKQGSGKSFLVKKYVIPTLAKGDKPIFVIDTTGEYTSQGKDVNYKTDQVFQNTLEMCQFLVENKGTPGPGIYVLASRSNEDCQAFFEIINTAQIPCSVIVEEADKFCSSHNIDKNLGNLIDYGRHFDCDLVFLARRAAKVHKDVTSQADCIVSFRQTELNDIKPLRKLWSDAEHLPELKDHHFLVMGDKQPKKLKTFKPGTSKKI